MDSLPQYPPVADDLDGLVADLVRRYRQAHPEEQDELEVFPPVALGPGAARVVLEIGRSTFIIEDNQVRREIRHPAVPSRAGL